VSLTREQETDFLNRFGSLLGPDDHWARADALLWAERTEEARRMLPRLSGDRRLLADVRLKLMLRTPDASAAVRALPAKLLQDEGVLYERTRWRRRNDDEPGAMEMLTRQPKTTAHAQEWWLERHIIARRLFDEQAYAKAYQLITAREQANPVDRAEKDFLAGWLALRFLDRPGDAIGHFEKLYSDVSMPISLARGAYWAGRAHEAAGQKQKAADWYRLAAKQPMTFYGQLAAGKLDQPSIAALPVAATPTGQAMATYDGNDLVRAARLLDAIGQRDRADLFLRKLMVDADTPEKNRMLATLALSMKYPFVAVRAAKAAARDGIVLVDPAYPLVPTPDDLSGLPPALVLGLARQESEFNSNAVSSAGAIGLMQLRPGTARDVAQALGIDHTTGMLSDDPMHNLRLGSRYLADLVKRYDSWPRAIAAYNAGFNRVDGWAPTPSKSVEQVVDWIESIPLPETRSYVQRVLENTEVYRLRLGEAPKAGVLEADLLR
jgi:soluble lytic murein transglycosylase